MKRIIKKINFVFLSAVILLSGIITLAFAGTEAGIRLHIDGPTVSPDGSQAAFVVSRKRLQQLCLLDLRSKKIQNVQVPGYVRWLEAFYGMSWDPEGRFIIVTIVEGTDQNPGPWSIWKVTIPEGKFKKISEIKNELCQRGLVSPDGKAVMFWVAVGKKLVSVNLESKKHQFLTKSGDVHRLGYDWSPDSSKIYFSRGFLAKTGGIWVMNADSSEKNLISDRFQGHSLGISSTERYMAFTSDRSWGWEGKKVPLFVSDLQKFKPVKISKDSSRFFDWSPNNDMLVFCSGNTVKIWTTSGKHDSKGIVQEIGEGHYPVWAENGQVILFLRNEIELWKYDVNSEKTECIFSIKE